MGGIMSKDKNGAIYLCVLYCFLEIMVSTEIIYLVPDSFFSLLKYIVAAIMTVYLIYDIRHLKYNSAHIPVILCFFVAICTVIFARSLQIYSYLLILVLLRNYSFKEILRSMYIMLWAVFLFTVLMSLINIYPNIDHSRNGTDRNALGFGAPTLGQSVLLFLLLSHFYLSKKKMSYIAIALYFVLFSVMYAFTAGRTGFYLSILAVAVIVFYKLCNKAGFFNKFFSSNALCLVLVAAPFIFLIFSLILTYLYEIGLPFAVKLNDLLSTRLLLQMNAFNEREITLFGQDIVWMNEQGVYIGVDNSYLYHLFNYGIIVFLGALVLYSYLLYEAWRRGDICMLLILSIILLDGMVEPYMLDFKYNYFILCASSYLFAKKRLKQGYKNSLVFKIKLKRKEHTA